jgi:serine protease Do
MVKTRQRMRWAWAAAAVLVAGLMAGHAGAQQDGRGAGTRPAAAGAGAGTQPASTAPPFTQDARAEITELPAAPLTPRSAADLKAIQTRVEAVVKMALPATVGVLVDDGQGSGVIVSKDGYVLTAGHVSGKPNKPVRIVLSNGVTVPAVSLGQNTGIDSGMVKITAPGEYPFVPVGTTQDLTTGQWVVALGHPGGYQRSRPPVLRLGRVLRVERDIRKGYVGTDCTLIMGDSGGPLFDLNGRLIGINSRIGVMTTVNIHVPVDTFTQTWDRLAKGEEIGGNVFTRMTRRSESGSPDMAPARPALGLNLEETPRGAVVSRLRAGAAAEGAGLQVGDVVSRFDGQAVRTADELKALLDKHKPGDAVTVDVVRGSEVKQLTVKLGAE